MSRRNPRRRWLGATSTLAVPASMSLAVFLLAACGSTPSAADQVCSDRSQVTSAISSLANDLRSGNFTKAKDDVSAVRSALESLSQSVDQLATEQRQAISPQIDNLKSTISGLKSSDSLSSLTTGLNSARSQLQSIGQQIGNSLNCSS